MEETKLIEDDQIVTVQLPLRDYKVMRELIDERQAMKGVKKWVQNTIVWAAAGLLTIFGLVSYFKEYGQ